jgi:hypothetical protein
MHTLLFNTPEWIQAGAAVALTVVTTWTLIILRRYAADTKRLAWNSAEQIEISQMPFVTLVEHSEPHRFGNWALHNEGFGAAINIYHSRWLGPQRENARIAAPSLGPGDQYAVDNNSANIATSQTGFVIEYESLTGRKFRTTFTRHGDSQKTVFEKLPA